MRALVVYYSRSGHTRALARRIAARIDADVEAIVDRVDRRGILGYLRSGNEATFHRRVAIAPAVKDPSAYDLVVIGTPVWRASLSSPVRAYLAENTGRLPRVAFFCTMDRFGGERVFRQMARLAGRSPVATLVRRRRDLAAGGPDDEMAAFAARLENAARPAERGASVVGGLDR